MFVFMLLMSPGIKGGTETNIAAAARQFCERHRAEDAPSTSERKTYNSICIPVPSMRVIHRGDIDMCAVYEPILCDKAAKSPSVSELLNNDS